MSYAEGFEDATELCIDEAKKANDKAEAVERFKEILELVKQHKFDRIKNMLGQIGISH